MLLGPADGVRGSSGLRPPHSGPPMTSLSPAAPPSADLPGLLRVFADATRLRILALLAREELTAGELARCLDQAPSRVSNHLRVLREHDLLQERRVGTTIHLRGVGASGSPLAAQLLETLLPSILSGPDHEADAGRLGQVLAARAVPEDFFDRVAGEYDKRGALFASGQARQRTVASLLQPGLVLADLGCGTGYMARALAPGRASHLCRPVRSHAGRGPGEPARPASHHGGGVPAGRPGCPAARR